VPPDSVVLSPGVVSSYKNGWRQLWKYFLALFLIGIIFAVIISPDMASRATDAVSVSDVLLGTILSGAVLLGAGLLSAVLLGAVLLGTGLLGAVLLGAVLFDTVLLGHSLFGHGLLEPTLLAYGLLIVGPVEYGAASAYLEAAMGDRLEIKDIFAAFQNYWNAVLASLLVNVIILVGFILLIVPGIIFACKLAFVHYLVVDEKMGAIEAIKGSWRMTNGHAWQVFLIGLLAIPISIAGLICFGVGIILAVMWVSLAFASLYHAINLSAEASV
jgi:uncharacterized membrane protein